MKQARIAVIGTGWWSNFTHVPGLLDNPRANLVAVADTNPETLSRCLQAYPGPKGYQDYQEMLKVETLDGVVVATSHASHHKITKDCLLSGAHVMLEKPMVLSATDAYDLVETASRSGLEIIVGHPYHFAPAVLRAREIITSGEIGAVQCIKSLFASACIELYRGTPTHDSSVHPVMGPGKIYSDPIASGGGQGHLQLTHSSALTFFVTNLQPDRVAAFMNNFDLQMGLDLVDAITARFKGGAVGTFTSTGNLTEHGQMELNVYCEDGYLLLDALKGSLIIRRFNGEEETMPALEFEVANPRFATAGNLVNVCLDLAPNGSPPASAVASVELLDAAYRSAAQDGVPVDVESLS